MKKIGIICEYNLFHLGHLRQIELIRQHFGECIIISLMSGNFVQRGEPAALPKYERAKAAVMCGSDMVFELPFPWSCSAAELFARGGVSLLTSLEVDHICFGSESGDITSLEKTAEFLDSDEFEAKLKLSLTENPERSYIKTRSEVFLNTFGFPLPQKPNDILGIEYLRALSNLKSSVTPFVIKREGPYTATETRRRLYSGEIFDGLIPEEVKDLFASLPRNSDEGFDGALLHVLRNIPSGDALTNRLISCANEVTSRKELYESASSPLYTNAHIKRKSITLFTGCDESKALEIPLFTTLLAADNRSTHILRALKDKFPIITKPADYTLLPMNAKIQFERSLHADSLYSLIRHSPPADLLRKTPFIMK